MKAIAITLIGNGKLGATEQQRIRLELPQAAKQQHLFGWELCEARKISPQRLSPKSGIAYPNVGNESVAMPEDSAADQPSLCMDLFRQNKGMLMPIANIMKHQCLPLELPSARIAGIVTCARWW